MARDHILLAIYHRLYKLYGRKPTSGEIHRYIGRVHA